MSNYIKYKRLPIVVKRYNEGDSKTDPSLFRTLILTKYVVEDFKSSIDSSGSGLSELIKRQLFKGW